MRVTDRFEYKYVLDLKTYLAFKNQLVGFMKLDYHTRVAKNQRYFVRSLYFDSYDFKHYLESEEGQFGRIKCRIRSYHHHLEDSDIISVEIKTKQGVRVKKYSQLISKKQFEYYEEHHRFNQSTQVLDEFTRLIYRGSLEPKLIVEYEREGFIPRDESDLRLTFDHEVRSAKSNYLFDSDIVNLRNHNHAIVCEVKCGMEKPDWLEQLIKKFGLKVIRNSKYVQAVQRIYPSIINV